MLYTNDGDFFIFSQFWVRIFKKGKVAKVWKWTKLECYLAVQYSIWVKLKCQQSCSWDKRWKYHVLYTACQSMSTASLSMCIFKILSQLQLCFYFNLKFQSITSAYRYVYFNLTISDLCHTPFSNIDAEQYSKSNPVQSNQLTKEKIFINWWFSQYRTRYLRNGL